MQYSSSTIFVTGSARPGKDDAISSAYNTFFVSLIIDKETHIIVNATCNAVREMTQDFIKMLLVNRNLITELDLIVQDIQERFFGLVQKTLIVALKDAHNRYIMITKPKF